MIKSWSSALQCLKGLICPCFCFLFVFNHGKFSTGIFVLFKMNSVIMFTILSCMSFYQNDRDGIRKVAKMFCPFCKQYCSSSFQLMRRKKDKSGQNVLMPIWIQSWPQWKMSYAPPLPYVLAGLTFILERMCILSCLFFYPDAVITYEQFFMLSNEGHPTILCLEDQTQQVQRPILPPFSLT